ncbi:hypothetical protein O3P69_006297 [Scylla paramamosain]|uniref:Uncharacterized protein n=1 Tax=Scylla paramamosain TaxID=85552 RepID=A0AAW0U1Q7_SCYPA
MQQSACGAVVVEALLLVLLLALPSRSACRAHFHAPHTWSGARNTQDVFDEAFFSHNTHNALTFPYKFEIPVISKRKLKAKMSDPYSAELSNLQPHQDPYQLGEAIHAPLLPKQQRLMMQEQEWPRPFDDARVKFLEVLAVVAVKVVMSTALASWFLVAGQVLFALADMTGTTEVLGNRSPLTFIFQALPLVEVLLKGSAAFD